MCLTESWSSELAYVLLKAFQELFNCAVVVVELRDAYRTYAEKHCIKMHPSIDAVATANNQRLYQVNIIKVLVHFPEPVPALKRIQEVFLQICAVLLSEVTNYYCHDNY
jgi:hypothetical protein